MEKWKKTENKQALPPEGQLQQAKDDLLYLLTEENYNRLTPADRDIIMGISKTFCDHGLVTITQAEFVSHIRGKLDGKSKALDLGQYVPEDKF